MAVRVDHGEQVTSASVSARRESAQTFTRSAPPIRPASRTKQRSLESPRSLDARRSFLFRHNRKFVPASEILRRRGEKFLGVARQVGSRSLKLALVAREPHRGNRCCHAALSRIGTCTRPAVRRLTFGFILISISTALQYFFQDAFCALSSVETRAGLALGKWSERQSKGPDQLSGRANLNQTEPLATL